MTDKHCPMEFHDQITSVLFPGSKKHLGGKDSVKEINKYFCDISLKIDANLFPFLVSDDPAENWQVELD